MRPILPIALAGMMIVSSCGRSPESVSTAGENLPESGDMYVTASLGDASVLNPVLAADTASGAIDSLVFNGLVKYNRDIQLTGDLAQSWDISDSGRTITFHLKKNVRWHDGEPFTADDVVFTWQKLIDPAVKTPYASDYALIRSVTAVDLFTVRVEYRDAFAPALESWAIGIIPRHIYAAGDFNTHPANRRPVGTGPYRFKEWKTDERIVLDANPDYFDGPAHISRYIFRIIPDSSVQFLELRREQLDEMTLTPDQSRAYDEFFAAYRRFRYPSFSYAYLGFNLRNPLFSDHRIRAAISLAIDKQAIIDGVLLGMGRPATGPFPPQSLAFDPFVEDPRCDPDEARQILADCGWRDTNGDGWLDRNGEPFEFTVLTNQGNMPRLLAAQIIQEQLRTIGIKIHIRVLEWSTFLSQFIDTRRFEAALLGWSLGRDPDQYLIWHSSQTGPGQYNFVSYKNPQVDRLLDEGRREFDPVKRQKVYREIHRLIAHDLPYVFLFYPDALPVVHKRFIGPEQAPAGIGWNFTSWWTPALRQKYAVQE